MPLTYPPLLDSGRSPFELFVLGLGLISGLPLVLGAPAPGTTSALLGPGLARVWGCILFGGCLVALVGVFWTWWGWLGHFWTHIRPTVATGLLIEQVGLVAVAVGTIIYSLGLVLTDIPPGNTAQARIIPAALVGALGLACLWRAGQIQRWVRMAIHKQAR